MELTLEQLKRMDPDTIFADGIEVDETGSPLYVRGTGKELRWVAVRGGIHDWAIYYHWAHMPEQWVRDHGDKVHNEATIKKLVPCDDAAFGMYRY